MMMRFDPNRPAQDMTCAELMAAHVAMGTSGSGEVIVFRVEQIYEALNESKALNESQAETE